MTTKTGRYPNKQRIGQYTG